MHHHCVLTQVSKPLQKSTAKQGVPTEFLHNPCGGALWWKCQSLLLSTSHVNREIWPVSGPRNLWPSLFLSQMVPFLCTNLPHYLSSIMRLNATSWLNAKSLHIANWRERLDGGRLIVASVACVCMCVCLWVGVYRSAWVGVSCGGTAVYPSVGDSSRGAEGMLPTIVNEQIKISVPEQVNPWVVYIFVVSLLLLFVPSYFRFSAVTLTIRSSILLATAFLVCRLWGTSITSFLYGHHTFIFFAIFLFCL